MEISLYLHIFLNFHNTRLILNLPIALEIVSSSTTFAKKIMGVVFADIISSNFSRVIFILLICFSEKEGLRFFQNVLLSILCLVFGVKVIIILSFPF